MYELTRSTGDIMPWTMLSQREFDVTYDACIHHNIVNRDGFALEVTLSGNFWMYSSHTIGENVLLKFMATYCVANGISYCPVSSFDNIFTSLHACYAQGFQLQIWWDSG